MKLAVIILNYNSLNDCRKCISFLKNQQGVNVEIILVDNYSADRVVIKELSKERGWTFLAASENRGYNAGNNIGLRYAAEKGYKYALIANPDMEFPQLDFLAKLVTKMEVDEDIVVCGSDIVTPDGIHLNPMKRDGDWRDSFGWITSFFKRKKVDAYDFIDRYQENHCCTKLSGCCLLVRLDFIQSINFFDESVFLYCEEAILSRQVENAAKRMYYLADVQAIHRHIKSDKGNPINQFHIWRDSRIYFINRYSGDSWLGKLITSFSVRLYVWMFTIGYKIVRLQWKLKKGPNQ